MAEYFTIICDDKKFVVFDSTIRKNKNNLFYQVIYGGITCDFIKYEPAYGNLYIDRDPNIFSWVILKLRGYNIKYNYLETADIDNILSELKLFGFDINLSPDLLISQLSNNTAFQELIKLNLKNMDQDLEPDLDLPEKIDL